MAPKFALPADDGTTIALEQLAGRFVVLFFYPKDDTPTCTAEACGFRDELPRFERLGAAVLGISPDSVKSHARFRKKHGLTYPLLSDEEHRVAERYGVWQEKQLFGHRYMGVARTTFIIGPDRRIRRVFENVRVTGHVEEVAHALEELRRRR